MSEKIRQSFRQFPVTMGLLGVIGLVFIAMQIRYPFEATSGRAAFEMGGMLGFYIQMDRSQWWRLITSLFIHIGWDHVLLNGFMLFVLGRQMEAVLGSVRFLTLFLLSGLMGNLFAFAWTPDTVVVGASGCLYGLSALFAVLYYKAKNPYIRHIGQMQVGILLVGSVMSFLTPDVSIAGHLGGAVGGALCAFFLPVKGAPYLFAGWQRFVAGFIYLSLVILAILY